MPLLGNLVDVPEIWVPGPVPSSMDPPSGSASLTGGNGTRQVGGQDLQALPGPWGRWKGQRHSVAQGMELEGARPRNLPWGL